MKKGKWNKNIIGTGLLSGVLALALSGCTSSVPKIEESINSALMGNGNQTRLAETLSEEGNLKTAYQLDKALFTYSKLKSQDLSEYKINLTDEEKEQLDEMPNAMVERIIETFNSDDSLKHQTGSYLSYLYDEATTYLQESGYSAAMEILEDAIVNGAVESLDLNTEEIDTLEVDCEQVSIDAEGEDYSVDTSSIYGLMINHLRKMHNDKNPSFERIVEDADEALNLVKVSAYSGSKMEGDTITSARDLSDVKELVKRTK